MLTDSQKEMLASRTIRLLGETGMEIRSDALAKALLAAGCPQAPSGRIRIPRELIEELAAYQRLTQGYDAADQELHRYCGIDWAHHIIWNGQQEVMRAKLRSQFVMSAFDCGPTTYYDYRAGALRPVDTEIFIEIKKFAQATPEIGYVSTWYRQDVPPMTERIASLALGLRYTDKLDGIEAIYPEVIKYLKEISEIITGQPGDTSYLAGSECITSPLIIEKRSADDILERMRCGVKRYHVATMPTIGVATPVALTDAVVVMAAEILGGMAACYVVDPEADLSGRAIALAADMRNANNTAAGPEVGLANLATKELFDAFWGGHVWVEVFFSTFAQRPGLQAVVENAYGQWRTSRLLGDADIPYPGTGTLHTGGMGSPTQFMLDMEIRKCQFAARPERITEDNCLNIDELCAAVIENREFLADEHTVQHFRELWTSQLLLNDPPGAAWAGDEKAILDRADALWRDNLRRYEPPAWPSGVLAAVDQVVERAQREMASAGVA